MIVLSRSKNAASVTRWRVTTLALDSAASTRHSDALFHLRAPSPATVSRSSALPPLPGSVARFARRARREREWPSSRSGRRRAAPARRCSPPRARSCSPGGPAPASSTSAATSPRSSGSAPSRAPASPTGSTPGPGAPDRGARPARGRGRARRRAAPAGRPTAPRSRPGPRPRRAPRSRWRCATARSRPWSTPAPPTAPAARALLEVSDATVVVVRGCYLTLRRAVRHPALGRAAGLVVVEEPGRAIGAKEIADVLGRPVIARVPARDAIAAGGRRRRARAPAARRCSPGRPPRRCAPSGCSGTSGARPREHVATRGRRRRRRAAGARVHQRLDRLRRGRAAGRRAGARAARAGSATCCTRRSRCSRPIGTSGSCASSPTRSPGSGRSSRCSPIPTVTEVMVNGPGGCFVERAGRLEPVALALDDARRSCASSSGRRAARAPPRPRVADGRRPPRPTARGCTR